MELSDLDSNPKIYVIMYFILFQYDVFYLGMVTMLPWNFLISINAFWNYKFRQVDNDTTEINQTTLAFMENSVSTSIWIILRNLTFSVGNCQESYLFHQMHATKTESTNLQISLFTFLQLLKKIHDKNQNL